MIVIDDVHGRKTWKYFVDKTKKNLFIGDYFDDYENTNAKDQIDNFLDIVEFCKNTDSIMLAGNHDTLSYVLGEQCSGYQSTAAPAIRQALKENPLLAAYTDGKYLFTHAGVSKVWLEEVEIEYTDIYDLVDKINGLWLCKPMSFMFNGSKMDSYGNSPQQGPMWARNNVIFKHGVEFPQVFGHTTKDKPVNIGQSLGKELWNIDTGNKYQIEIIDNQLVYY